MKLAKGLKITTLVLMSLLIAFFLFMGIGEMVSGDTSGIGHLFPVAIVILLGLTQNRVIDEQSKSQ